MTRNPPKIQHFLNYTAGLATIHLLGYSCENRCSNEELQIAAILKPTVPSAPSTLTALSKSIIFMIAISCLNRSMFFIFPCGQSTAGSLAYDSAWECQSRSLKSADRPKSRAQVQNLNRVPWQWSSRRGQGPWPCSWPCRHSRRTSA